MKLLRNSLDGQDRVDTLAERVVEWVFVASGEWSESPWHQGNVAYHLGRSEDGQVYVLSMEDIAMPEDDSDVEDFDSAEPVNVAALVDARDLTPEQAVRALIAAVRKHGGKKIESFDELGEFPLD